MTKDLGVSADADRAGALRAEPAAQSQGIRPLIADAESFFPFTLHAVETPHYTSSPHAFRDAFLKAKGELAGWYAYDVTVKSRTAVEFTVYDMRDNFYGGIGKQIARFATKVSAAVTADAVERRIRDFAEVRRRDELQAAEDAIIAGYVDELRDALAQGIETRSDETRQGLGPKGESPVGSEADDAPTPSPSFQNPKRSHD